MKISNITLWTALVVAMLSSTALADIGVTRELPNSVLLGTNFTETITISGYSTQENVATLKERVPEEFQLVSPKQNLQCKEYGEFKEDIVCHVIQEVYPSAVSSFSHTFRADKLGTYYFQPVKLILGNGSVFSSIGSQLNVVCKPNSVCEPRKGENYLNCPEDCQTGTQDNVCDGVADGKCDPDCISSDPDCIYFCGDGNCDEAKENPYNCKEDCGTLIRNSVQETKYYELKLEYKRGTLQIYNVSLKRGILYSGDVDQGLSFVLLDQHGNTINTYLKAVTREGNVTIKLPYSPIVTNVQIYFNSKLLASVGVRDFSSYCGDGRCDLDEGYLLCPLDCPSGVADDFCDKQQDGICDPDCSKREDKDCRTTSLSTIIIIIVALLFVMFVLAFLVMRSRRD